MEIFDMECVESERKCGKEDEGVSQSFEDLIDAPDMPGTHLNGFHM